MKQELRKLQLSINLLSLTMRNDNDRDILSKIDILHRTKAK